MSKVIKRIIHPHTIKRLEQTGMRKSKYRDFARSSMPAGKRISKTGHIYWETRKNRSDFMRTRL